MLKTKKSGESLLAKALDAFGGLDGLVANPGGGLMGTARVREPVPVEIADDADFTVIYQAWQ